MFFRRLIGKYGMDSKKMFYPSAHRNKTPILSVLKKHINPTEHGKVLEISSGTGQHCSHFAMHFPNLHFQPSEYDNSLFESITAYAYDVPTENMLLPIKLDVTADCRTWKTDGPYDYLININLIHISPWSCSVGLFKNCCQLLRPGGLLFTYGPYANEGKLEPESNVNFNRGLKAQNPEWGVRDIQDLIKVASEYGMRLKEVNEMPSNNKCLVWEKQ